MFILPAETLSLADSASTTAANIVVLPAETLSLTDSATTTAAHTVVLPTETLSLTDSASTTAANIVVLPAETLSLTDSASTTAANEVILPAETLSLTDSASTTAANEVILPAETLSLTDSATTTAANEVILPAETLSLTDSASTTAANIVDLPAETLSLTDSATTTAANIVVLPTEILSLTDSATTTAANEVILPAETLSLTDSATTTAANEVILPTETLSLVDVLSNVKGTEVAIVESLLLREEYANQPTNIVAMDTEIDGLNGFDELGIATGVDTFTLTGTYAGTYAIVVSQQDDSVTIIDVSNPSNIVEKDTETDGLNDFEELDRPFGVDTFTLTGTYAGTYAIVTAFKDDGVQIIDVSNPENIVAKDYLTDTDGAFLELDGAKGVDTFTIGANTYAIVTAVNDDGVQVIDVSNPENIVAKGYLTDDGTRTLDEARDVKTFTIDSRTYAIVVAVADNGVQIIDVTNPESIIALSNLEDSDVHDRLKGAFDVEIFTSEGSTYAIVASKADDAVQMIDVSDPEDIRALQFIPDDDDLLLQEPKGVDTFTVGASTYAIVASFGENGVQIIDVTNPESISATISLTLQLEDARGIRTFTIGSSTYAIVTAAVEDGVSGVQIIELSSTTGVSVVASKIVVLPPETLSLADSVSTTAAHIVVLPAEILSLSHSATIIGSNDGLTSTRNPISDRQCFHNCSTCGLNLQQTIGSDH